MQKKKPQLWILNILQQKLELPLKEASLVFDLLSYFEIDVSMQAKPMKGDKKNASHT